MDLVFSVKEQTIKRTDSKEPVELSKNYLNAKFEFETPDWDGLVKTAVFTVGERTYNVVLEGDECKVPYEATKKSGNIFVSVFGGDLITANSASVFIANSGYSEGAAPVDPEPTVYEQITEALGDVQEDVAGLVTRVSALETAQLPVCPSSVDGNFRLVAVVSSGEVSYSWEAYTP